jgi:hypothetical protein
MPRRVTSFLPETTDLPLEVCQLFAQLDRQMYPRQQPRSLQHLADARNIELARSHDQGDCGRR